VLVGPNRERIAMSEVSRVKYYANPNKASRIKMWDDTKPVYMYRMEGDFTIHELREIIEWAEEQEGTRR